MEKIYEKYVGEIMELVDQLGNKIGELLSTMENDGKEIDDDVFELIDDLKDGMVDDVEEAVNIIMSK